MQQRLTNDTDWLQNRFATQPEIYKQFLEILQTYQKESKPIQDVYAQVTQLFNSAPDLLEDFKQFLPESAAQAKAQAAAKQAEDAAMLSNVRGEYGPGSVQTQMQTPRPEMKMPPVGNFAPPSATKVENKKRRGGPGSQMTGGAAAIDPGVGTSGQNIRNGVGRGNANKVSCFHFCKHPPPLLSYAWQQESHYVTHSARRSGLHRRSSLCTCYPSSKKHKTPWERSNHFHAVSI